MNRASVIVIISLCLLIAVTIGLIRITSQNILTLGFYKNAGEIYPDIPGQMAVYQEMQRFIELSSAAYILFKVTIIAVILYSALYFSGIEIRFVKVLNVVTLAEFVFFIPALAKIILFPVRYPNGNLSDWHRFYILSVLSLVPNAQAAWIYPLQTLNAFEIIYWFLLAYGIFKITRLSFDQSLQVVIFSYLPALFIWVCTITFCTLVMFPTME